MSVVERRAPALACTRSRTTPSPEPDAPSETVTQGTVLAAVHVQPVFADTAMGMLSGPRPAL